jgi:predicted deacylase
MAMHRHPVATLASGGQVALYVHEFVGMSDGPTFGLCAGVHGDEAVGVEILWRFAARLRDLPFRGRVLMVPVANPLALEGRTRHSPLDMLNFNRTYPGDPNGWVTERMAAAFHTHFLDQVDAMIDFHAGGYWPTVDYVYIVNAEELSRAFGSPLLYRPGPNRPGPRPRRAKTVTVELGGGPVDQTPYVERGVRGIENVMRALGMLDGPPAPAPVQTVVDELVYIRPKHGGLLVSEAQVLGAPIAGGDLLGRVVSPYTFETLETLSSPFAKGIMILSHLTVNVVQPGDFGYMVGNLEGASA